MIKGGLDAAFFIVYVGQGAADARGIRRRLQAGDRQVRRHPPPDRKRSRPTRSSWRSPPPTSRASRPRARRSRSSASRTPIRSAPISSRIKEFYDRGARYMSLAHNGHSQLSDSNTGEREGWMHNGLSELGRKVIVEMNRVGIMVDVSHPSKQSMMQTVALLEGADHRVAFGGARARQSQPQHGRRAAARVEEERRRDSDGRVCRLREDRPSRTHPSARRRCRRCARSSDCLSRARAAVVLAARRRRRAAAAAVAAVAAEAALAALSPEKRAEYDTRLAEIDKQAARRSARDRAGLRQSHRLRREADRHRSRRHLVGLRRRRRRRRLERRERDVQRHAGARAPRLHRAADCASCGAATCCG